MLGQTRTLNETLETDPLAKIIDAIDKWYDLGQHMATTLFSLLKLNADEYCRPPLK